jgi:hypothetical protein
MSKSKKTTKAETKKATKAAKQAKATAPEAAPAVEQTKATKKAKVAKPKRVSALDAAAQVLQAEGQPMPSKALIEAMAAKGLWASPGGKTPHATLYAAMLREINAKGTQARFRKVDRGQFAFNG